MRRCEGQGHPADSVSRGELAHASGDRVRRAGEEALPGDFPECLEGVSGTVMR